jgi:hypothetical protein
MGRGGVISGSTARGRMRFRGQCESPACQKPWTRRRFTPARVGAPARAPPSHRSSLVPAPPQRHFPWSARWWIHCAPHRRLEPTVGAPGRDPLRAKGRVGAIARSGGRGEADYATRSKRSRSIAASCPGGATNWRKVPRPSSWPTGTSPPPGSSTPSPPSPKPSTTSTLAWELRHVGVPPLSS